MSTSPIAATRRGARAGRRFAREPTELGTIDAPCLLLGEPGQRSLLQIAPGWTRIGRSPTAEVRLEDPSVSRRHALLVRTPRERLRILDDRSLTGVYVNGERIEWAQLGDGDELVIGRFRLIVARSGRPADAPLH